LIIQSQDICDVMCVKSNKQNAMENIVYSCVASFYAQRQLLL